MTLYDIQNMTFMLPSLLVFYCSAVACTCTRGNADLYIVPHPRVELFKKSLLYQLPSAWNNLNGIRFYEYQTTFICALKEHLSQTQLTLPFIHFKIFGCCRRVEGPVASITHHNYYIFAGMPWLSACRLGVPSLPPAPSCPALPP